MGYSLHAVQRRDQSCDFHKRRAVSATLGRANPKVLCNIIIRTMFETQILYSGWSFVNKLIIDNQVSCAETYLLTLRLGLLLSA